MFNFSSNRRFLMFFLFSLVLTAYGEKFDLTWFVIDSVFDFFTMFVACNGIVSFFSTDISANAIYNFFFTGQQLLSLGCLLPALLFAYLIDCTNFAANTAVALVPCHTAYFHALLCSRAVLLSLSTRPTVRFGLSDF